MTDFFMSDLKFTVTLIIAIMGILLSIVLYSRSLRIKTPCYTRKGSTLIDPELIEDNPINVTFLDQPVERLTMTYLAFWNNGRATITRDDIAETDPLRIVANQGCNILAVDIIHKNKPPNNFEIEWQDNLAIINFDFIDYKNGIIIRIYHTGKDYREVDVVGTIKSTGGIINVDKTGEMFINVFTTFEERFKDILLRFFPRWLLNLLTEVEARQNILGFLVYVFLMLPLIIILAPFLIIFMLVVMIIILVSMLQFFLTMGRYSLPKELFPIMRYI